MSRRNDTKTRLVGEMRVGELRVGEMRIYLFYNHWMDCASRAYWSMCDFAWAVVLFPDHGLWSGNETTCAHVYKVRKWYPMQRTV